MLGPGSGRQDAALPTPVEGTPCPASLGGLPPLSPPPGVGPAWGTRGFSFLPPTQGSGLGPARLSEWPAGPSVTLKDARQSFLPQLPTTAYITNT